MAGLVKTHSIPTLLEIEMAAMLRGQEYQCSCGCKGKGDYKDGPTRSIPTCEQCELKMWPMYNVHNKRGYVVGEVVGLSHNDALETVRQTPQFDRLKSFTVSPKIWGQK